MGSTILFYGPGARQAALNQATGIGILLAEPFGDEGLAVEQAREITELLKSSPISEKLGVVVIGPMDNVLTNKSSDALLKTLEDPSPYVQAILWADDLGGVPLTIRSRCTDRFAPPGSEDSEEEDFAPQSAWILIQAYLDSDYATLVETLEGAITKEEKKQKGLIRLIEALTDVLGQDLKDSRKRVLWEKIREVAKWRNPSSLEILAALVSREI